MPRATIDYMNARRECKPASGGKRYVVTRNAFDDKQQWAATDRWEQVMMDVQAIQDEFLSWARNHQSVESIMRGETDEDLSF